MSRGIFYVKCRKKGTRKFLFLAGEDGSLNRLKIHAVRLINEEVAKEVADEIERANPDWEAKVVPA